jgi:hypothetical protein
MEKVLDYTGAKGLAKMRFTDTNLAGTARIKVTLFNEKDESVDCYISEPVSAEIRAGKRTKDSIAFLNIVLDEERSTEDKPLYRIQRALGKNIDVFMKDLNLKEAPQVIATFEEAAGY